MLQWVFYAPRNFEGGFFYGFSKISGAFNGVFFYGGVFYVNRRLRFRGILDT